MRYWSNFSLGTFNDSSVLNELLEPSRSCRDDFLEDLFRAAACSIRERVLGVSEYLSAVSLSTSKELS